MESGVRTAQPIGTHSFFLEDSYMPIMSLTGFNPSWPVTVGGLPRFTASITSSYYLTKEMRLAAP